MKNIFLAALLSLFVHSFLFAKNASALRSETRKAADLLEAGNIEGAQNIVRTLQQKEDKACLEEAIRNMIFDPIKTYSRCLTHQHFSSLILLAASLNHWQAMKALMIGIDTYYTPEEAEQNLNLNLQYEDGNTALHYAAQAGKGGTAKFLITYGASKHIYNNEHDQPYDLAKGLRRDALCALVTDPEEEEEEDYDCEDLPIEQQLPTVTFNPDSP